MLGKWTRVISGGWRRRRSGRPPSTVSRPGGGRPVRRELVWAVELDRGRSWSAWSVMVGIVVREWHAGLVVPRHNDGDVMIEYSALGDALPPTAAGSRFDDHRSYFIMVFDHRHDLAGEDERRAAFAFMAGDLARLVQELPAETDLRGAVAAGLFDGGFVRRRLREAQA